MENRGFVNEYFFTNLHAEAPVFRKKALHGSRCESVPKEKNLSCNAPRRVIKYFVDFYRNGDGRDARVRRGGMLTQEALDFLVENQLTEVGSITLEVGEVSGIIPEYLVDCWKWATKKRIPALQEAELKIEKLEAVTYCENCGQTYPTMKYAKICPHCKSDRTYLLTGNEYNIKEIEAY